MILHLAIPIAPSAIGEPNLLVARVRKTRPAAMASFGVLRRLAALSGW
jgi:hypothetical protein